MMLSSKIAAVMSSLKPSIKGKPTPAQATLKPRPKTPTTPGLGAKMREETARSLETMLKEGAFITGLEPLVKAARDQRMPMPSVHNHPLQAAKPGTMSAPSTRPAQPSVPTPPSMDARQAMNTIGLPEARTVRDNLKGKGKPVTKAKGDSAGLPPVPNAPSGGTGGGGKGGFLGRFMRPGIGRTMGLVGVGALGAGLYGMHRQNEEDRQKRSLIYAPMPGSVMQ